MSVETEAGLSRSKLLKRAAIVGGAAVAWSTPFVTSASAADASTAALTRTKCRSGGPGSFTLRCNGSCPSPFPVCGTAPNGTTCYCFTGRSACCECQGNYFCSDAIICTSNAGCPSGFKCVSSCCDSFVGGFTCAPPCGSGISASVAGATAAG
jgi:hypothetical protein